MDKYLRFNFEHLKDMEHLVSLESHADHVLIKGIGKDGLEVAYETTVRKAIKSGLIDTNIINA